MTIKNPISKKISKKQTLVSLTLFFLIVVDLTGCGSGSSDRISYPNQHLNLIDIAGTTVTAPLTFSLTLAATVAAPVVNGSTLGATDVALQGNYAYVTYNLQGASNAGALDTFDITTPSHPLLVSHIDYADSDTNAVAVTTNKIFIVGATSAAGYGPSYLRVLSLSNGIPDQQLAFITLPSFAANSVLVKNSKIYISSGDQGGLSVVDATSYAISHSSNIFDSRWLSSPLFSTEIYVFAAQPGRVLTIDQSSSALASTVVNLGPDHSLTVGGALVPEAKSTIESGLYYSLVALGNEGFRLFCNLDGKMLSTQTPPAVSGIASADNVTNAATAGAGLIFSANGGGGVHVYSASQSGVTASLCQDLSLSYQGQIDFGQGTSSNHVFARNDLLFAAAGTGGLKIVQVQKPIIANALLDFTLKETDFVTPPSLTSFASGGLWQAPVAIPVSGTISVFW